LDAIEIKEVVFTLRIAAKAGHTGAREPDDRALTGLRLPPNGREALARSVSAAFFHFPHGLLRASANIAAGDSLCPDCAIVRPSGAAYNSIVKPKEPLSRFQVQPSLL